VICRSRHARPGLLPKECPVIDIIRRSSVTRRAEIRPKADSFSVAGGSEPHPAEDG
jgi:hypothetical protein